MDLSRIKNRREVFGWAMFDFANSSFTTVIITTLYAVYFSEHVAGVREWGLANAISQLLVVLSAPVVGALADFSGAKKRLLFGTYLGCVVLTVVLGLIPSSALVVTIVVFVLANFCYSSGENLVAGFLPEIAEPENVGKVSGIGWSIGYFGGLAALVLAFVLSRGLSTEAANRAVCLATAAFFLLAGIPTFLLVRERKSRETVPEGTTLLTIGFRRVATTWTRIRHFRQLFRFLAVFLVFSCGVASVVTFCTIYAKKEFGFDFGEIVVLFGVISVASAAGAFGFGLLQDRVGSRRVIQLTLFLWCVVVITAALAQSRAVFWAAGLGVGICIGSTQSASRALVSMFSPPARAGEFLGFWGSFGKLSAVVGPLLFGLFSDGMSIRTAVGLTAVWFVLGFAGMFLVDEKEGIAAAHGDRER